MRRRIAACACWIFGQGIASPRLRDLLAVYGADVIKSTAEGDWARFLDHLRTIRPSSAVYTRQAQPLPRHGAERGRAIAHGWRDCDVPDLRAFGRRRLAARHGYEERAARIPV